MRQEAVDYRDGEVELTGRFVYDEHFDAKRPGMLVVHGGAGLDDHAVEQATRLAELGLVAFACDMYGHEVAGDRDRTVAAVTTLRDDPVMMVRRAAVALEVLASHPDVNRRLGVIGYCFGGLVALQLARSGTAISAAISVHGSLATSSPAKPGEINARILACHGALDPFVPPAQVLEFVEEMNRAEADWQLNIYGGAVHGFTHRGAVATPGVGYDATTDARSFAAIKEFLTDAFDANLAAG